MKIKNKISLLLSLTFITAFGVSDFNVFAKNVPAKKVSKEIIEKVNDKSEINWSRNIIKVTGAGAAPEKGSIAQKRLMALRAARADAYRNLLETINGVNVNSETEVRNFVTESDVIKTKVEGFLKGAQPIGEPKYFNDGSVEIVLQVSLFGENSLAEIVIPQEISQEEYSDNLRKEQLENNSKEETEKEKPVNINEIIPNTDKNEVKVVPETKEEEKAPTENPIETQPYTSLIVDCRGLKLEPAMSPAVLAQDGKRIYITDKPIDPDYVINEGIVSYVSSLEEAKKNRRAGKNPLIVKGKKSAGIINSDVEVENQDQELISKEEEKSAFLKNCQVIFVI